MKLFPYALVRLGGDTYDHWATMDFSSSNGLIDKIFDLKQRQQAKKLSLCDRLFEFISNSEDPGVQNDVQNLRRDIFNERKLKNSKIARALEALTPELAESLRDYIDLLREIKSVEQSGENIFGQELKQGREQLKEIVNSDYLKKGLILSSRTLLNRLDSFRERPVEKFRKKEFQIEQSLLQYLTRMYAKTSPFSTFTNLAVGTMGQVEEGIKISAMEGHEEVKGHIRLNNYLLKYIMDLLKNYRPAYLYFPVRCNPTLQQREDHFLYLTNNNNIESFQRIPENPVVAHITDLVREHIDGVRFDDLITALQEDIDASREELEGYVKQLIDYGLLEYHLGVSGVDPDWDVKLIEAFAMLIKEKVPHIDTLVETLQKVRRLGDQYADSDLDTRKQILEEAYDSFRAICMKIHEAAGLPPDERKTEKERLEEWQTKREEEKKKQKLAANKSEEAEGEENTDAKENEEKEEVTFKHETSTLFSFKPEQLFYEDTTREVKVELDQDQVEELISNLYELLSHMRLFQGNMEEKDKMKEYFLNKYGSAANIDLLTYYEDYFREFKKPEKEREEKRKELAQKKNDAKSDEKVENAQKPNISDGQPVIEAIRKRNESIEKWREVALSHFRSSGAGDQDEICFDLEPVKAGNTAIGFTDIGAQQNSYGSFLQFFREDGKVKAVINGTFPGYGKMASRFLHIFDPTITDEIKAWNERLCKDDEILLEDCDASYFNANLHPTLMPYEIWMPGGHNSLPADRQIPITDFSIVYDEEDDRLCLMQRSTNKRAHVFDLGFQGHQGRSQLFQLLEKFTKAEYLFTQPLTGIINRINSPEKDETVKEKGNNEEDKPDQEKKQPSISTMPRVVYKDQLILQRKSWFVPKLLLPARQPQDSDWQYYERVNLWRKENRMPDEVFVFVNPNRWGSEFVDPEAMKKLTRDDYKPQYINFTNALLVNLLEKLVERVPVSMKIVEMLPNSNQMLTIDGSRYVSEFVMQWYNNN